MNAPSILTELSKQSWTIFALSFWFAWNVLSPIVDCRFVPESKGFVTRDPRGVALQFIIPSSFDAEKALSGANQEFLKMLEELE